MTVSVAVVEGVGEVLVDADGAALYAADQESEGVVSCFGACNEVWEPLTVSGSPTGPGTVGASLGIVTRPNGPMQVTFFASPLYRCVRDPGAGTVTGNGLSDEFGGHAFTWHVATPDGISTSNKNSDAPSSDNERGYGG